MKDPAKYIGVDMHMAHAIAIRDGEQLRVLSQDGRKYRYADEPAQEHIQVEISKGIITRAE